MKPIAVRASLVILIVGGLLLGAAESEAQYYQYFGKNPKIRYRNFDWKIYHSTHFDVYYYEDEAEQLQRVVSFAESAYDYLSREFDYQIKQPTPLIYYRTHAEFQQSIEANRRERETISPAGIEPTADGQPREESSHGVDAAHYTAEILVLVDAIRAKADSALSKATSSLIIGTA